MTDRLTTLPATGRATGLALLAGLAVSLSAPQASAISFVKLQTNYDAWNAVVMPVRDEMGNITGTEVRRVTGAGVTVGMIEAAQPNLDHIAFEGLDYRRIWYPFETALALDVSTVRGELLPTTDQGSLRFPVDLHRHATAVAGAIAARNTGLFGEFETFGPLTGIAPDVNLLTGALVTEVDPSDGAFASEGIFPASLLFTMAAMTDIDLDDDGEGDFIEPLAEWYGVEPWEPASVINISFGDVSSQTGRAGEDAFSRLANIIAWRTDTVIVAAVGDSAQEEFFDELEEEEGSIAAPAAAHNVIAVGRTGDGADSDRRQVDSGFGPIIRFDWLSREGDQYLVDPMTNEDYDDVEFMGDDPRQNDPIIFPQDSNDQGQRVAVDLLAPGTMITLPSSPLNGPLFLSDTDVWEGWEGTSFASAIVTGAVAMMQEYGREWGHSIDPVLIRAVLMNSAEKSQGWSNQAQMSDDVNAADEPLEPLEVLEPLQRSASRRLQLAFELRHVLAQLRDLGAEHLVLRTGRRRGPGLRERDAGRGEQRQDQKDDEHRQQGPARVATPDRLRWWQDRCGGLIRSERG